MSISISLRSRSPYLSNVIFAAAPGNTSSQECCAVPRKSFQVNPNFLTEIPFCVACYHAKIRFTKERADIIVSKLQSFLLYLKLNETEYLQLPKISNILNVEKQVSNLILLLFLTSLMALLLS